MPRFHAQFASEAPDAVLGGTRLVPHLLAGAFPLAAGIALYGWRAAAAIALILASVVLAWLIWRRIGPRGATLRLDAAIWTGLLLGLMLPAHLFAGRIPWTQTSMPWALLMAGGLLLVMLMWAASYAGLTQVHALLLSYLVLAVLFFNLLIPHTVLRPDTLGVGDVLNYRRLVSNEDAWIQLPPAGALDAIYVDDPAARQLGQYTRGRGPAQRQWVSIEGLVRDGLPPLEDLVVGGHPAPIGLGSAVAVLIGGLFLLYRGIGDWRVPALIIFWAMMTMLVLPLPAVIGEDGARWRPLLLPRAHQDWATLITFLNYELMASPLLFAAFFIATAPAVCPQNSKLRHRYAILAGLLSAAGQVYLSCSLGAYLGIGLAGLVAWVGMSEPRGVASATAQLAH